MKVSRFNDEGIREFEKHVELVQAQEAVTPGQDLLISMELTEYVLDGPEPPAIFESRYELGIYLVELLRGYRGDPASDPGLWAWLSAVWFSQLCPKSRSGQARPGTMASWIPQVEIKRRFYRHRLLGPYVVARAHGDDQPRCRALLADPLTVATSDVYREFVEHEYLHMKAPVELATLLYFDEARGKRRIGHAAYDQPGNIRRFRDLLNQLDVTFDLHTVSVQRLADLLPAEFDPWKARTKQRGSAKVR
jgi:hypothetical protein